MGFLRRIIKMLNTLLTVLFGVMIGICFVGNYTENKK